MAYSSCTTDLANNAVSSSPEFPFLTKFQPQPCSCLSWLGSLQHLEPLLSLLLSIINHFLGRLLCEADSNQPSHRRVPSPACSFWSTIFPLSTFDDQIGYVLYYFLSCLLLACDKAVIPHLQSLVTCMSKRFISICNQLFSY